MFDIGWAEMAVIAVVTLIIVGPKDLPNVLRTGARWMRQLRKLSREFQSGVDSLVREAELDEAKKIVTSAKQGTLKRTIETAVDPTGEMAQSLDPKRMMRDAESDKSKTGAPKSGDAKPAVAKSDVTSAEAAKPAPAAASAPSAAAPKGDTLEGAPSKPAPAPVAASTSRR